MRDGDNLRSGLKLRALGGDGIDVKRWEFKGGQKVSRKEVQ